MAVVDLPTSPGPADEGWLPINFGSNQQGPLGGAETRINRLGSKWQISVQLPRMDPEVAAEWSVVLTDGLDNLVRYRIRQVGMPGGSPGSPVVDGNGQAGSTLACRGFNPGYAIRKGKFFSLISGGQRYCYRANAAARADANGEVDLPIVPALRAPPSDGDVLEFASVYIEGRLGGAEDAGHFTDVSRLARGFQFTIREMR